MGTGSQIEWTEATWNPVTGCTKISPGCKNCYAERMAKRSEGDGESQYGTVSAHLHEDAGCRSNGKAADIFVNSMSDLFHADVPLEYIQRVFEVMHGAGSIRSRC